jgi:ribosomal protein S8E
MGVWTVMHVCVHGSVGVADCGIEEACVTFVWPVYCAGAAIAKKTRILDVVYNASNNELVRTKTLVKSCIVQVIAPVRPGLTCDQPSPHSWVRPQPPARWMPRPLGSGSSSTTGRRLGRRRARPRRCAHVTCPPHPTPSMLLPFRLPVGVRSFIDVDD